ncbi:MAG: hypothetical protein QOJ00_2832 [Actinomycetota bacterium]
MSLRWRVGDALLRRHRAIRPLLPRGYHAYPGAGGWINLDVRESPMMLARALRMYEPAKTKALTHALRPGMTFVDVGGNKGDFALIAAKATGCDARVLCIEPEPENVAWIRKSVERNRYRCVEVLAVALAERDGEDTLFLGPKSGWHTLVEDPSLVVGRLTVPTRTLDGVLAERGLDHVDVLKIDVEGAEDRVLAGGVATFSGVNPMTVFLDLHPKRVDTLAVCNQLEAWGFTFCDLRDLTSPAPAVTTATKEVVAVRA